MLKHGVDIRSVDALGRNALHSASINGIVKVVRLLIDSGLDPNIQDKSGRTPLHDSARAGKPDVTKLLLELGADRSIKDGLGRTAHTVARQHGHRLIVMILEGKEDTTEDDVKNLGPIPDAESLPVWSLAKLGMKDLVEKAIARGGTDLYETDPDSNDTALHWAIDSDHLDILELLLCITLDPNALNDYSRTPLHTAARAGNLRAVIILLDPKYKVKLDIEDNWGSTPLLLAQAGSQFPIATALIAAGASIHGRKTAIQPLFFTAVELGNVAAVENLINSGADVLAKSPEGQTGLQIAKENGHGEVMQLLQQNQSFYKPMRSNTERSRESGGRSADTTPGSTPGATPVVSPRLEAMVGRKSFSFRPRPVPVPVPEGGT